jgi:hypothetical protein
MVSPKGERLVSDLVKTFGVISLASALAFQLPSDVFAAKDDQFISGKQQRLKCFLWRDNGYS